MRARTGLAVFAVLVGGMGSGAVAYDFHEPFLWKGNHAAVVNNGQGATVFWNEDDWDVMVSNDYKVISTGDNFVDISRATPSLSAGEKDESSFLVGGDGGPGVGVMRLTYEGISSARLRNPMLIAPGAPGVVEFRAPLLVTSGHWWEVAIAPSQGILISGPQTSVPSGVGSPGRYPAEDSLNFVMRGSVDDGDISDAPCMNPPSVSPTGWASSTHVKISVGPAARGQNGWYAKENPGQNWVNALAPQIPSDPTEGDKLFAWRLEFHTNRVDAFVDQDEDGVLEAYHSFPISIPWSEVYVYLLAVGYEAGHHPQTPCYLGLTREFKWKDVRVSPVKYARTAAWPKNQGIVHTPQATGLTGYDARDVKRWGSPVNGLPQANATRQDTNFPLTAFSHAGSGAQAKTFHVNVPGSVSDVSRALLVYEIAGTQSGVDPRNQVLDGTATVRFNGTPLGEMPGRRTIRSDNWGTLAYELVQRSVDVTGRVQSGDNVIEVTITGNLRIDRIHLELDHSNPTVVSPPAVPGAASALKSGPFSADVSWTRNSTDEDGFLLERSRAGGPFQRVATLGAGQLSFQEAGLEPATSYVYRVKSFNRAGVSAPGGVSLAVITNSLPAGSVPAAPTGLAASAPSSIQADLTWNAVPGADGYVLEGAWPGYNFGVMGRTGPGETSLSLVWHNGASGNYRFRVKAFNAHGDSAYSSIVPLTLPSNPGTSDFVAAPTGLTAVGVDAARIHLVWTDQATNEGGYAVERSPDGSSWIEVAVLLGAGVGAYMDENLSPSTNYHYRVRAVTNNITAFPPNSAYAGPVQAATLAPGVSVLVNPGPLKAVLVSPQQIDVTWGDNSIDEDGFHLERSLNGGPFTSRSILPAGATSFSDSGLTEGVTYSYRVRASKGSAFSTYSNVDGKLAGTPTQPQGGGGTVTGPADAKERLLTPGTRDGVNDEIFFPAQDVEVEVISSSGRMVFRASASGGGMSWDGRDASGRPAPAGLYVARLRKMDGSLHHQRILIVK